MKTKRQITHGVPGINLRPRSIKSGRPLQTDITVQYRSDLHMQELYSRASELQERLQDVLGELTAPPCAATGSLPSQEETMKDLKTRCDETIMVLQIAKKIDSELYYAREALKKAIDAEDSSLIHLRRKRVQWLENKLEEIALRRSSSKNLTSEAQLEAPKEFLKATDGHFTGVSTESDVQSTVTGNGAVAKSEKGSAASRKVNGSASGPSIKPVLLTELSTLTSATSRVTANSRVTIKTPDLWEEDDDVEAGGKDEQRQRSPDAVDEYWNSEHHRFEFSALAPVMASLDPNTLHQVALAVPGTYVSRPSTEHHPELPWREQGDDIHDIHREALDRLSAQIHHMYDKVYDAAMASVNRDRAASFSAHSHSALQTSSSSAKKHPAVTASAGIGNSSAGVSDAAGTVGVARASLVVDLPVTSGSALPARQRQLPPLTQEGAAEMSSKHAATLVYHPKPIPPPQQLPLTRVNRNRHYPQPISAFAVPFNESERERPERLVNQGSIYDETRLVIYKPTAKPRTAAASAAASFAADAASGLTSAPQTAPAAARLRLDPTFGRQQQQQQRQQQQASVTPTAPATQPPSRATMHPLAGALTNRGMRRGNLAAVETTASADGGDRRERHSTLTPAASGGPTSSGAKRGLSRGGESPASMPGSRSSVRPERLTAASPTTTTPAPGSSTKLRRAVPEAAAASSANETADDVTSKSTAVSIKKTFNLARVMAKLREGATDDEDDDVARKSDDPLQSGSAGHSGLKWERVKELLKVGLTAPAPEERADAAKQLGVLRCTDPSVIFSMKQQIAQDDDERVQYECAKSLLSLGCLENEVLQIAVDYLIVGNLEVRLDIIKCISNARNIQYISKKMASFKNLVKTLAHFCQSVEPSDPVAYEAAVCFGKLCVRNPHAVDKMKRYLVECKDTHKKALTLRILIKQFNEGGWDLVEAVLKQLTSSSVWEYRVEAAQLLQHLGRRHVASTEENAELVYSILEQRLWDDSQELVRLECAKTLVLLEMYARASETAIKQLSDPNETLRAQAVTSLGTLGIKTSKIVRHLLEMLDLDPSDMVRRQVIRAFGAMSLNDKRVVRALKERERAEGMLGSEAKKVLQKLESATTVATSTVRASAAA